MMTWRLSDPSYSPLPWVGSLRIDVGKEAYRLNGRRDPVVVWVPLGSTSFHQSWPCHFLHFLPALCLHPQLSILYVPLLH